MPTAVLLGQKLTVATINSSTKDLTFEIDFWNIYLECASYLKSPVDLLVFTLRQQTTVLDGFPTQQVTLLLKDFAYALQSYALTNNRAAFDLAITILYPKLIEADAIYTIDRLNLYKLIP